MVRKDFRVLEALTGLPVESFSSSAEKLEWLKSRLEWRRGFRNEPELLQRFETLRDVLGAHGLSETVSRFVAANRSKGCSCCSYFLPPEHWNTTPWSVRAKPSTRY